MITDDKETTITILIKSWTEVDRLSPFFMSNIPLPSYTLPAFIPAPDCPIPHDLFSQHQNHPTFDTFVCYDFTRKKLAKG